MAGHAANSNIESDITNQRHPPYTRRKVLDAVIIQHLHIITDRQIFLLAGCDYLAVERVAWDTKRDDEFFGLLCLNDEIRYRQQECSIAAALQHYPVNLKQPERGKKNFPLAELHVLCVSWLEPLS